MRLSPRPRVVVTHWTHPEVQRELERFCEPISPPERGVMRREEVLAHAREAAGLIVCMNDTIDDHFLEQCPNLRIIAAVLKGYDNFDVAACRRRGILFTISTDLLTIPTAELTLGLILSVTRNVRIADTHMRSYRFEGWRPQFYGLGLHGSTVGIIGFGKVGRAVGALVRAFGANVLYHDGATIDAAQACGARGVSLQELLRESDVVVPLLPLTEQTRHLLDEGALSLMKRGAYVVNASRGSIVDEAAVAARLRSGALAGYGADVFACEDWALADRPRTIVPELMDSALNTVFTPHLGSAVDTVRKAMSLEAAHAVEAALTGTAPVKSVE